MDRKINKQRLARLLAKRYKAKAERIDERAYLARDAGDYDVCDELSEQCRRLYAMAKALSA